MTVFLGAQQCLINDLGDFLGVIARVYAEGLAGSSKALGVDVRCDIFLETMF